MKAIKSQQSTNRSLEETALRYKLLQSQSEQLERVLKALRSELEHAIKTEGDGKVLVLETFKLSLSSCERENFSLKSARKSIPEKVLKPFISITAYSRLSVNERGTRSKIAA